MLGVDEDGDPIRSLVARHLLMDGPAAMPVARLKGPDASSYSELLLTLLREAGGTLPHHVVRQRFYERARTPERDTHAVNKGWNRALAKKQGFFINEHKIFCLKETGT